MGAAVAAVLIRERELVAALQRAGATDASHAVALEQLDIDPKARDVRRLRARAVLCDAAPGLVYLDEMRWAEVRRTRLRIILTIAGLIALALALALGVFGS